MIAIPVSVDWALESIGVIVDFISRSDCWTAGYKYLYTLNE